MVPSPVLGGIAGPPESSLPGSRRLHGTAHSACLVHRCPGFTRYVTLELRVVRHFVFVSVCACVCVCVSL